MPRFVIDFAAAQWDFITFNLQNKFVSGDTFMPGVDSIHYRSETDPLYKFMNTNRNYENPIVIEFEGGHRPPKILSIEAIQIT